MSKQKRVTCTFRCCEKESIDLKIRLRYDGIQQGVFFRELLDLYINKDPLMMTLVSKIKEKQKSMGKKKIKKSLKEIRKGAQILEDLGITDTDKQEIYDMLEGGLEYE